MQDVLELQGVSGSFFKEYTNLNLTQLLWERLLIECIFAARKPLN